VTTPPGDYVQIHPYTFELSYAMLLLGLGQGALNFIRSSLQSREFLQEDDHTVNIFGEMLSDLQATRASLWYAQWLWQQGDFGEATDASLCAQNQAKRTAIRIATQGFEVVGVRGLFKFNPLERIWRDIRTVTLHTRESQLMRLVSEGALKGNKFPKKKYGKQIKERRTWEQLIREADGQPAPLGQMAVNA